MSSHALVKAGVYLLRPPERVFVILDRELLILFCPRYPRIVGAVLFDLKTAEKDLYAMLGILFRRTVDELSLSPQDVTVKAIGFSRPRQSVVEGVTDWLTVRGLELVNTDIGGGLRRHCVIDSESGKIGVRHEEPTEDSTGFRLTADIKHFAHARAKARRASP